MDLPPEASGARATFEEQVMVRKEWLRRLAFVARPFFRLNHSLMMGNGRTGLQVYLAGYRAGVEEAGASPGQSPALTDQV